MIYRGIAALAGVVILGAAAHVTIEHTGGYETPHAILTMAIALGVAIGAIIIGTAWSHGRYAVAIALAIALICGEAFGLIRTAERLIEARAESAAPLHDREIKRQRLQQRVDEARRAVESFSVASPRLAVALKNQKRAQDAVAISAAKRSCARNCRQLLQAAVDSARAEVVAARQALEADREAAKVRLGDAVQSLESMPPNRSANVLADRLQIPPWAMDLITAALGAIGANGLGAALLAFGGHAPARRARVVDADVRVVKTSKPAKIHDEHAHIRDFAQSRLAPDDNASVTFETMVEAYRTWCRAQRIEALPLDRAAELFAELVNHLELRVEQRDGDPVILGLRVDGPKLIEAA